MSRQLRRAAQKHLSGVSYARGEQLIKEVVAEARSLSTESGIAATTLMTGVNSYYNAVSDLTLDKKPRDEIKSDVHGVLKQMSEAMLEWLSIHTQDKEDEIAQLKARIAELEATHSPQEKPMPKAAPTPAPTLSNLEMMSLCAFLRAQGIPAKYTAQGLTHPVTDAQMSDWRAEYPDEAAMLRGLRAIVRPILERAA